LDRRRASVECLELPHAYEHLFVLARHVARRRSQRRGDEALGMSDPPSGDGITLVPIVAAADIGELLVMNDVAATADVEREAFFVARSQGGPPDGRT
jgi:hypothetical protein